jgi:O-antigen ligase
MQGHFSNDKSFDRSSFLQTLFYSLPICAIPWLLGGNLPFVRLGLAVFAFTLLAFFLVSSFFRSSNPILATSGLPIWVVTAALIWCGWQTFAGTPQNGGSEIPSASRERLAEIAIYAGIGLASAIGFASILRTRLFLALITINTTLFSLFGMFQQVSFNGKIYWVYERISGGAPFAAFVNRNNAAGYLLLGFAASLFFWIRNNNQDSRYDGWLDRFSKIDSVQLFRISATLLIAIGILATLSRGGIVALAATIACCIGLLATRQRHLLGRWGIPVVGMTLAIASLPIVFSNLPVSKRLATLNNWTEASSARIEHWTNVTPYLGNYWLTGSGLGTYKYCYPLFQEDPFEAWYVHAENQYIEAIAETGLLGILLYLMLFGSIGWLALRLPWSQRTFAGIGLVGFACVVGQMVSGVLDFGMFLPANASLMACLAGMIIGMSARGARISQATSRSTAQSQPQSAKSSWALRALVLFYLGLAGWSCVELSATECRRVARRAIERYSPQAGPVDESYEKCLAWAAHWRPDDFLVDYQQGQLNTTKFRFQLWQQLKEAQQAFLQEQAELAAANNGSTTDSAALADAASPNTRNNQINGINDEATQEATQPTIDLEVLWNLTSLSTLHRAYIRERIPVDEATQELAARILIPAREAFERTVSKGNWSPRSHLRLAQFEWVPEKSSDGQVTSSNQNTTTAKPTNTTPAKPTRSASELAAELTRWPAHPELLYHTGLIAFNRGEITTGCQQWQQCLQMGSSKYFPMIIAVARRELPMRIFFEQLLPQEPVQLVELAHNLFEKPEDKLVRGLLLKHTSTFRKSLTPDRPDHLWVLAELSAIEGNIQKAEEQFVQAIEQVPENRLWQLAFGRFLISNQRFDEATTVIRGCLFDGDQKQLIESARAELRRIKLLRRQTKAAIQSQNQSN